MREQLMQKLEILADSAKYDVSCSSSGSGREAKGRMGNTHASGICHSWSADGRCVSLLKVLFTNKCVYNCEYCVNRREAECLRAAFEPEELAELTMEFYRRNYIEGLFLSSAVEVSPDYTAERILKSLQLLRYEYGFAGYIHAKIIPGVSPELVHEIGLVSDRLSVNIEMPTSRSLEAFAPQKKAKQIFAPMRQITNTLIETNSLAGPGTMFKGQKLNTPENYLGEGTQLILPGTDGSLQPANKGQFAPAGQTTQMIIGAGGETDRSILTTSENLYRTFKMKRVYYSAYIPVVDSPILPDVNTAPPLAREHRIYQADWLLRFYGFTVSDLFGGGGSWYGGERKSAGTEGDNLDPDLDPKVMWALRNLDRFPIEVNKASYEELLRIPGIGHKSAKRIIRQRRFAAVRYEDLRKIGVVLKRAKYFMLCCGRYYGSKIFEPEVIRNSMLQMESGLQMSMFDNDGSLLGYDGSWQKIEEGERREKLAKAGVI
ncbi:MAG: putative DNA modification/repair radical SAM protein [Lentihominibacter sp.]